MQKTDSKTQLLLISNNLAYYQSLKECSLALNVEVSNVAVDDIDAVLSLAKSNAFDALLIDCEANDEARCIDIARLRLECDLLPILALCDVNAIAGERAIEAGADDWFALSVANWPQVVRNVNRLIELQEARSVRRLNEVTLPADVSALEKQIESLQETISRFENERSTMQLSIRQLSHDFRTPLTVIKDYVAIIRDGLMGDVSFEQQSMLARASLRVDDLNQMIDTLLDLSKIQSRAVNLWRTEVSVCDMIERVVADLHDRASVAQVKLAVELGDSMPSIFCDEDSLERVLAGIVINAIKHTRPGGQVRIALSRHPDLPEVVVEVIEDGCVISPDSLEHFESSFELMSRELLRTEKGLGLELAVLTELCRLNLGELELTDDGNQSSFRINLPACDSGEIIRRWLQLDQCRDSRLEAFRITALGNDRPASRRAFESLIACIVNPNELLLTTANSEWLLVSATDPETDATFLHRLEAEYDAQVASTGTDLFPTYKTETLMVAFGAEGRDLVRDELGKLVCSGSTCE